MSPLNGLLALFIVVHGSQLDDKDSTLLRPNTPENIACHNEGTSDLNDQSDSQCDEWKSFLIQWNLDKFSVQFEDSGWTDIRDWHQIDEDELKAMGLQKGHITRFLRNIEKRQRDMNAEEKARQITESCGICGDPTMLLMIYMLGPFGIFWGCMFSVIWGNYRRYRYNVAVSLMRHADEQMLPEVSSDSTPDILLEGGTPDDVRKSARIAELMKINEIPFQGYQEDVRFNNDVLDCWCGKINTLALFSIIYLCAILIGTLTAC